jgi:hypothetical protein
MFITLAMILSLDPLAVGHRVGLEDESTLNVTTTVVWPEEVDVCPNDDEDAFLHYGPGGRRVLQCTSARTVALETVNAEGGIDLPHFGGEPIHRVVFDTDLRFDPDRSLDLVTHTGSFAPRDLGWSQRRDVDDLLDGPDLRPRTLYVPCWHEGVLAGELRVEQQHRRRFAVIVGAAFALFILGGVLAFRRLATRARAERAEAYLESELAKLDE